MHIEDKLEIHDSLRAEARSKGSKTWYRRQWVGDSFYRELRRWHLLNRIIDRSKNWYFEHIADKETGEVIRHVDQPLSDHTDRGSAKKSAKDQNG
jgi:hypothetical protein